MISLKLHRRKRARRAICMNTMLDRDSHARQSRAASCSELSSPCDTRLAGKHIASLFHVPTPHRDRIEMDHPIEQTFRHLETSLISRLHKFNASGALVEHPIKDFVQLPAQSTVSA